MRREMRIVKRFSSGYNLFHTRNRFGKIKTGKLLQTFYYVMVVTARKSATASVVGKKLVKKFCWLESDGTVDDAS